MIENVISIKAKAAILFLVFSVNTLISIACTLGLNLGINSRDDLHNKTNAYSLLLYKDGTNNKHKLSKKKRHVHPNGGKGHAHVKADGPCNDDCCNDSVFKFQNLDKTLSQIITISVTVSFAVIPDGFYDLDIFKSLAITSQKFIVRPFHPPAPDILILIQRFLI